MHIPKPLWVPDCEETWARFQDIRKEWRLERAIYKDRVVKAGRPARSHSVSIREAEGGRRKLPDSHFYA